jgi:plasmid stabilization system protein ParE
MPVTVELLAQQVLQLPAAEFERVAKLLVEFPGIGTPADELRRDHPQHDFPWSVTYRELNGRIRVLVVRGQFRDSAHGEPRR